jgi:hypothetical protein
VTLAGFADKNGLMRTSVAPRALIVVAALVASLVPSGAARGAAVPQQRGWASACGATSGRGEAPWPEFGGNGAHSGDAVAVPRPPGRLRQQWESEALDGAVYGEPLVAGGCVFVATEGGSVYALSEATGAVRWRTKLAQPVPGGLPCGDILPSGITGTPVLDPASGVLFAVALTEGRSGPEHELFALSAKDGKVLRRVVLSVPGRDQAAEQQRGALVIDDGNVYVPFGGLFGDCGNYAGAVASVPEAFGRHPGWWEVPTARGAGIWEPGAPEVLAGGQLLLADGNGAASPGERFDGSNAVFELSPSLRVVGYFAPSDWAERNGTDQDLGSTAPAVLAGERALAVGKDGVAYLISTSHLGGVGGELASGQVCGGGGAFGSDAVSGDVAYVPCTGGLVAVEAGGKSLRALWSSGVGGWGSALFAEGRVFEETQGGDLLAISASSGRALQEVGLPAPETHFPWVIGVGQDLFSLAGRRVAAFSGL